MSGALSYVTKLFDAVLNWFNQIFDAIPNSAAWVLAVFAMYCAFRFLIVPIAGGRAIGGSDSAKKSSAKDSPRSKSVSRQPSDPFGDSKYGVDYYYDR